MFDLAAIPESRVCQWVERQTDGTESCLEFGAGLFTYVKAARSKRKGGIEAFQPYLDAAEADPECKGIALYKGDMTHFGLIVAEDYDVALLIDVIEHVTKSQGLQLLRQCQEHFKKVCVFSPIGKHEKAAVDGNILQIHLSSWYPSDMTALGFEVEPDPYFHHTNPKDKQGAFFAVWTKEKEKKR